jgi:hypothetical protein
MATLGSFSVAPIWSLRRLNMGLTPEEELAYLLLWRHIGYACAARHTTTHYASATTLA